jgi:hypothetical protein
MKSLIGKLEAGRSALPTLRSVSRRKNLQAALGEISRRAVGLDGLPFEAYADPIAHLRWNPDLLAAHPDLSPLEDVQGNMIHGCHPDAAQLLEVHRRTVEVGTTSDRIIGRAISRKLSAALDHRFSPQSWGFRPHRSPEQVILKVRATIRQGAHWAFKTDIHHFFDSISRPLLERMLRSIVPDQDLCDAILNLSAPTVVDHGISRTRLDGLPQGNGISPILSNIYLHALDTACADLHYFRYADDLLVLAHTAKDVQRTRAIVTRYVSSLGLGLKPGKTIIVDLYRRPIPFLGYKLRGGNVYPSAKSISSFQRKLGNRGQDARKALMLAFVRRYRIGPVRKLFCRLDREYHRLYPPGMTLVGLLKSVTTVTLAVREAGNGAETVTKLGIP